MAPPYRQPSQVGATAATKRPFKPPAIAKAGPSSSSSGNPPPAHRSTAATAASKPVATTSKAAGSRPQQAWGANTTSGFRSAGAQIDKSDLEALLISDDDDEDYGSLSDDDDDDDDTAATAAAAAPPTKRPTAPATTIEPPAAKKQKTGPALPPRLPSLSPLSSAIQPETLTSPAPASHHPAAANIGTTNDSIPLLPSALITRLLHESFDDKTVKIGKEANALTARYLDLFVREAVARATEVAKERMEMKEAGAQGAEEMGDGDVWLDVQDLEEVAPGLVLDF